MVLQQKRSTFRAQLRRRMVRDGDEGGEGDPSVAMLPRTHGSGHAMRPVELRTSVYICFGCSVHHKSMRVCTRMQRIGGWRAGGRVSVSFQGHSTGCSASGRRRRAKEESSNSDSNNSDNRLTRLHGTARKKEHRRKSTWPRRRRSSAARAYGLHLNVHCTAQSCCGSAHAVVTHRAKPIRGWITRDGTEEAGPLLHI